MPLEPDFDHIDDLDSDNPFPDDPVSEGDDHLRGIKNALQGNVSGDDLETRLLVAGLVAALVDADKLSVLARALIDLDNSAEDELTEIAVRNLIGGYRMAVVAATGQLQIDQLDNAGAFEKLVLTAARDGAATLFHPELAENALRSVDRRISGSSAEVFDTAGVAQPVGYNTLPNIPGNASFTLQAIHNGKRVRTNGAIVITVLGTSDYPIGGATIVGNFSGTTNINATAPAELQFYTGETRIVGDRVLNIGGNCTITRVSANTYEIWGNGLDIP